MFHSHQSQRGSLILLVMCLLAVLGIALASYLSVSRQAMKLSNRSAQNTVSDQLAEMGLEEALRAFNSNNWATWSANGTTATWSLSGSTASCTITLPAAKYGSSGVTGVVKIRVDNYNAYNQSSTWVGGTNYQINDLVGYNGLWYRCVKAHSTSQTPAAVGTGTLAYWVPSPVPWDWEPNFSYKQYDVVNYNGTWYRCTVTPTTSATWTGTNWTSIPAISLYNAGVYHAQYEIVYFPSAITWYYCTASGTPGSFSTTALISWQYQAGTTYNFNDLVCYYNGSTYTWYRYINSTPTSGNNPTTSPTYWQDAQSGANTTSSPGVIGWSSSGFNYRIGDIVYYSGSIYRCILAHTSSTSITPSNASYWTNAPLRSPVWDSGRYYAANSTVTYNGTWYRCITANSGSIPSSSGNWSSTANSPWSSATSYSAGTYVSYGGVWYKCIVAPTANQSPNNSTYWTAQGAPVIYAQATATLPDGSPAITTELRATVGVAPLFPNALAANSTLTISGAGTVDSYDSTLGTYASQTPGYSAVLAAGNTSSTAITISSTTVKGYFAAPSSASSPYGALVNSGGSLKNSDGSVTSPASGAPNIDLTRISRSPYIPQFDCLPSGGLTAAFSAANFPQGLALNLAATTNIGTPGATTPSRYYYNGNLTLSSATGYSIININGPVILYINGNLTMDSGSPNGKININSAGSAEIHVAGRLNVNVGSDGINNTTLDPKKLTIICDTATNSAQNYSDGFQHGLRRDLHAQHHQFHGPVIRLLHDHADLWGCLRQQNRL
jgi:Tfp pilus assembly protein PilX